MLKYNFYATIVSSRVDGLTQCINHKFMYASEAFKVHIDYFEKFEKNSYVQILEIFKEWIVSEPM